MRRILKFSLILSLLCLSLQFNEDTTQAGHQVFINDLTIQQILNSNLKTFALAPLTINDSSFSFSDGYQQGLISFTGLSLSFPLQPASTAWNFSYTTSNTYVATLTNIGSLAGKYMISFPQFIESGAFAVNYPNNSIQINVQLEIEADQGKPAQFNLKYLTVKWISSLNIFDYGTKACYFFRTLSRFFNAQFTSYVNGQINTGLPNLFSGDLISKPQAFINSLLAQTTPLGSSFKVNYAYVSQSTPTYFSDTNNYLGFKTDGTVYLNSDQTGPDQTSKPTLFATPNAGNIVHTYTKYFIYSAFFQAQRQKLLTYQVDKTTKGADLSLVQAKAFPDLKEFYADDATDLQIIFSVTSFDPTSTLSTQVTPIVTKIFNITYTVNANNAGTWKKGIIATAQLSATISLSLSGNNVIAQITSLTISGSQAQAGAQVTTIKDKNIDSTVTKIITYSLSDLNAQLAKAEFSTLAITGTTRTKPALATTADLSFLQLTYNLA